MLLQFNETTAADVKSIESVIITKDSKPSLGFWASLMASKEQTEDKWTLIVKFKNSAGESLTFTSKSTDYVYLTNTAKNVITQGQKLDSNYIDQQFEEIVLGDSK